MQDMIGPEDLFAGTGERHAVEDGRDEVFNAGIVDVFVRGERFLMIGDAEDGAAERIKIDFAVGSYDAELVALDMRVPANVNGGMDAGRILEEDGGGILDGRLENGVGEQAGGAGWFPEEEVHGIDAMTSCIKERAAAGFLGIEEPASGLIG